jgi:hypothetical protein
VRVISDKKGVVDCTAAQAVAAALLASGRQYRHGSASIRWLLARAQRSVLRRAHRRRAGAGNQSSRSAVRLYDAGLHNRTRNWVHSRIRRSRDYFLIDAADAPDGIVPFLRLGLLDGTCADLLMFESAKVSAEIAVLDRGWGIAVRCAPSSQPSRTVGGSAGNQAQPYPVHPATTPDQLSSAQHLA